jgi:quinoprotein glucose dehydrogenase
LQGFYLYGDYVSGKIWALKFDFDAKRVVSNRPIPVDPAEGDNLPVVTFGEDEQGEVYLSDAFGRIFWITK